MTTLSEQINRVGFIKLSTWLAIIGLSRTTVWRLRRDGKLKTFTRYGRPYVSAAESERFLKEFTDWEEPCSMCPTPEACESAQACVKTI